jgi:hypothetical protein
MTTDKNAKNGGQGWADAASWVEGSPPTGAETWTIGVGITLTMNATPGALTGHGYITGGTLHITAQAGGTLGAISVTNSGATRGVLDIAGITGSGSIGNIDATSSDIGITATAGTIGTITLNTTSTLTTSGAITATIGAISVLTASTWAASHSSGTFGAIAITGAGSSATFTSTGGTTGNIVLNAQGTLTFAGSAITTVFGAVSLNNTCSLYQNGTFTTGYCGSINLASPSSQLYASRSISSYLRTTQITTNVANGVNYGIPVTDPISNPAVGAVIEFVCTSDNQAGRGIVLGAANSFSSCGATRGWTSFLATRAASGVNTIQLDPTTAAAMAPRQGTLADALLGKVDLICVGHTPIQTANGAVGDEIDTYLVAGYDPNTHIITLGDAGLGMVNRGGVTATWNTIHQTDREINTPVWLMTSNVIFRGTDYNHRPQLIFTGNYTGTLNYATLLWHFGGIYSGCDLSPANVTFIGGARDITTVTSKTYPNTIYHFGTSAYVYYLSNGIITAANLIGCAAGFYYGAGNSFSGLAASCTYLFYLCHICQFSGQLQSSGQFCDSSMDVYIISPAAIIGCSLGLAYGNFIVSSLTIDKTTTAMLQANVVGKNIIITNTTNSAQNVTGELNNCSWAGSVEPIETGQIMPGAILQSWTNQGSSGAFKGWMLGGTVLKAINIMPTGATYSYEHACVSATYPCFRQLEYTMKRYEKLHYRTWVRKTASMTYLPRIQIIDKFIDPLLDAVNNAAGLLAETQMSNSIDTWEQIDAYYYNNSDMPKRVLLRTLAMNATGTVYFYPSIIKNEDNVVCCDSEGAV